MRYIFLTLLLAAGMMLQAQHGGLKNHESLLQGDSVKQEIKAMADSGLLQPVLHTDSLQIQQETERNINNLLSYQRENNRRAKQKAFLYLGLGVGFLALLIIGLSRRRKKSA